MTLAVIRRTTSRLIRCGAGSRSLALGTLFAVSLRANILRWAITAFSAVYLAAQTPSGSLNGIVRDSTGAAMAGVRVTARSSSQGFERLVATSPQGDYVVSAVPPGEFELVVAAPGFRS